MRTRNPPLNGYHAPETLDNRTIHVLVESGKLTQDTLGLMLARKFNWHDDEGVHWLLEHGADPKWPLWEVANMAPRAGSTGANRPRTPA